MPNKVKWATEWPTEAGDYWFYGWLDHCDISNMVSPMIYFIEVWGLRIGEKAYTWGNEHLKKDQGGYGLWTKIEFPELPEIERPEIEE